MSQTTQLQQKMGAELVDRYNEKHGAAHSVWGLFTICVVPQFVLNVALYVARQRCYAHNVFIM